MGALQLGLGDSYCDPLLCAGDTQMNKIQFLPIRSSWSSRKIDMTMAIQRGKCYYREWKELPFELHL